MSNQINQNKEHEEKVADSSFDESDFDEEDISDISSIDEEEPVQEEYLSEEEIEYEQDSSDDEEELPIYKLFKVAPNLETMRNHPPDIKLKYSAMDLCFHPTEKLLASCNYVGECTIFRYDSSTTEKVSKLKHHKKSCRKVCYTSDGSGLCSISEDKSIAFVDINAAQPKIHMKDAHESGVSAVAEVDDNTWATGDDDGTVKIWDVRQRKAAYTFKGEGEEAVVDFAMDEDSKYLVAGFENCSLMPIRLKNYKPKEETIGFGDHRLTSLTVMNEYSAQTTAVGSCDSGKLVLYKYGTFLLEAFALTHSGSVNCMVPYSNTKLITGCDDGKIRLAGVCPCKSYGVIGTTTTKAPVLSIAISNTDDFLASSSADDKIQFWTTDKMENIKSTRRNPLHKKKNYRVNEKILKSSRNRSVSQFLQDIKGNKKFKDKGLPTYNRALE